MLTKEEDRQLKARLGQMVQEFKSAGGKIERVPAGEGRTIQKGTKRRLYGLSSEADQAYIDRVESIYRFEFGKECIEERGYTRASAEAAVRKKYPFLRHRRIDSCKRIDIND